MSEKKLSGLTLSSNYEDINKLLPFLKDLQHQVSFSSHKFDEIRLALNEAVTNAILHGNKQDPQKKVVIAAFKTRNDLKISVQDEGSGFDPSTLSNPLNDQQLLKESGRGLFLIRQYTNRLDFADGASKVIMYFSLDD